MLYRFVVALGRVAGRNINNLRYTDDTTLMAESEEELKSLLMTVKEESEKVGLKLNIKKTKIMASGSITSWQINGETVETVADYFFGLPNTADGDCSHEIKRRLLLGRKVMANLDSILKSRDITLPTKVCLVKAMVFPVVVYGCESWTIKKAEPLKIDAFELWYWRRLLRVPWTVRRSNQSILKKISPRFIGRTDTEAESPILWPPDAKSWLIWKDPGAGKDWGQEEKGTTEDKMIGWYHRLNGHVLSGLRELVMDREAWRAEVHGVAKSQKWLTDWTELNWLLIDAFKRIFCEKHSWQCCCLVAQSCLTLCGPMDCSPPGSFVHGIFQSRILEWVATLFSSRSSQPTSPAWAGGFFTAEPPTLFHAGKLQLTDSFQLPHLWRCYTFPSKSTCPELLKVNDWIWRGYKRGTISVNMTFFW